MDQKRTKSDQRWTKNGPKIIIVYYHVRQSHSISAQNARVLMDEYSLHSQGASNGAGMLTSSASKTGQGMVSCVISFALGQVSDGSAHALVCNRNEPLGDFLNAQIAFHKGVDFLLRRLAININCSKIGRKVALFNKFVS